MPAGDGGWTPPAGECRGPGKLVEATVAEARGYPNILMLKNPRNR